MKARPVRRTILLVTSLVLAAVSNGQQGTTVIQIDTNVPGARVYFDDTLAGLAGAGEFVVSSDVARVGLVPQGIYSWSVPPLSRSLAGILPGDTVRVRMYFPYYYRLESSPAEATVSLTAGVGRTFLGTTPTTVKTESPLEGTLVFDLDGFNPAELKPGNAIWNLHTVDLQPLDDALDASRIALSPTTSGRSWIDYAALGTALVAGVLAVHFKFEADRRFDRYQESGDPDLRPGVKRYDVYSGIALGVMQAGIGVFAIRLVLR